MTKCSCTIQKINQSTTLCFLFFNVMLIMLYIYFVGEHIVTCGLSMASVPFFCEVPYI